MLKRLKNQRGIALILVMSFILFLTIIVFDFWNDAQMGHQLASNYRARMQAYYLAKSAVNFSKLLLYFNKKLESMMAQHKVKAGDVGFEPLYKQIPVNSGAIRALLAAPSSSSSAEAPPEADEGEAEEGGEKKSLMEEANSGVGLLQKGDVETFLSFEGDFDAEISEEQSKYSLNAVSKMVSTSASYDLHKKILLSMLMQPQFKVFFENQEYDAILLVHALADFVDNNTNINEFDKVERGSEDSVYGSVEYRIKDAPYLSVSELRLVAGMSDDILELLRPMVTVYHPSDKINICLAEQSVVDALIVHFTHVSECTTPIDLEEEKDKEDLAKLRDEMLSFCPDSSGVASAFNSALGIQSTTNQTEEGGTGCKIEFKDLITDGNDIFRIKSTGSVKGVTTTVTVVIDTSPGNVKDWNILYYQVD
ncbi:MAG: general secretion pathway protein GspK [Deltaproteobacteria bacterium]|nr:general secretion pathway protein GspK [Deltaproteobacteria bacterium]